VAYLASVRDLGLVMSFNHWVLLFLLLQSLLGWYNLLNWRCGGLGWVLQVGLFQ